MSRQDFWRQQCAQWQVSLVDYQWTAAENPDEGATPPPVTNVYDDPPPPPPPRPGTSKYPTHPSAALATVQIVDARDEKLNRRLGIVDGDLVYPEMVPADYQLLLEQYIDRHAYKFNLGVFPKFLRNLINSSKLEFDPDEPFFFLSTVSDQTPSTTYLFHKEYLVGTGGETAPKFLLTYDPLFIWYSYWTRGTGGNTMVANYPANELANTDRLERINEISQRLRQQQKVTVTVCSWSDLCQDTQLSRQILTFEPILDNRPYELNEVVDKITAGGRGVQQPYMVAFKEVEQVWKRRNGETFTYYFYLHPFAMGASENDTRVRLSITESTIPLTPSKP